MASITTNLQFFSDNNVASFNIHTGVCSITFEIDRIKEIDSAKFNKFVNKVRGCFESDTFEIVRENSSLSISFDEDKNEITLQLCRFELGCCQITIPSDSCIHSLVNLGQWLKTQQN